MPHLKFRKIHGKKPSSMSAKKKRSWTSLKEEPVIRINYIVDSNRKWKVACEADSADILRLQAARVFCDNMNMMDFDTLVVYKTGEPLDVNDRLFRKYRYYMYLKQGEKYTADPEFDVVNMEFVDPPPRVEVKRECPPAVVTSDVVEAYKCLALEKRYLDDKFWIYEEEALLAMVRPTFAQLREKLEVDLGLDESVITDIKLEAMTKLSDIRKKRALEWPPHPVFFK